VFWQTTPRLGLYGEYNRLWVDGGHGDEAELRATYRLTRKSTVGLERPVSLRPGQRGDGPPRLGLLCAEPAE
jgi:hypothetical protein